MVPWPSHFERCCKKILFQPFADHHQDIVCVDQLGLPSVQCCVGSACVSVEDALIDRAVRDELGHAMLPQHTTLPALDNFRKLRRANCKKAT